MQKSESLKLSISWRLLCVVLLIANLATVALWRPWVTIATSTRKVSVTGETTLKAVPDQYQLNPYFEFTNTDRSAATAELTKLSTEITAKLKTLGVKEEQITSNTNAYDKYDYAQPVAPSVTNTLQLNYTITVEKKELAQTVQDYMLTLKPKGQLSPQATFSETKRKELEATAREKAIDDAKAKAKKTAQQLGAKLGKVISISDATRGGPIPLMSADAVKPMMAPAAGEATASSGSVQVQPGQNDFSYTVSVEYEIK